MIFRSVKIEILTYSSSPYILSVESATNLSSPSNFTLDILECLGKGPILGDHSSRFDASTCFKCFNCLLRAHSQCLRPARRARPNRRDELTDSHSIQTFVSFPSFPQQLQQQSTTHNTHNVFFLPSFVSNSSHKHTPMKAPITSS